MEQTKTTIYATEIQWSILQWLFHYPNIYLVWADMYDNHVNWSAYWADEEARQHMIKTMDTIGVYFGVTNAREFSKPRIKPMGGTPHCHFNTFKSLLKENLICRYQDINGKTTNYFQLSPSIRKDLEEYEFDKLMGD